MKVAIYGKSVNENHLPFIQSLFKSLTNNDIEFVLFHSFYKLIKEKITFESEVSLFRSYREIKNVDYFFSIGGDGTILDTITLIRDKNIPILGINTGRLGYLSSISTDEVDFAIANILKGNFELDKRTLLSIKTENDLFGKTNFALNEIALQKKDTSSMITIHAYLDGDFLNSYWADGLIISTPTGSTAYSLSCNGPIVLPNSGNIIITPIAPHNLNVRPLVIPDDKELTLTIEGRTENFLVTLDTRSKALPLSANISIKKTDHQVSLIRLKGHNYLNTLRNKLMWGVDKRN